MRYFRFFAAAVMAIVALESWAVDIIPTPLKYEKRNGVFTILTTTIRDSAPRQIIWPSSSRSRFGNITSPRRAILCLPQIKIYLRRSIVWTLPRAASRSKADRQQECTTESRHYCNCSHRVSIQDRWQCPRCWQRATSRTSRDLSTEALCSTYAERGWTRRK